MTSDYQSNASFDQVPPPSAGDEIRNAHDHFSQAAGAAADHLLPHDVRRHVRAAVRHLFSAGIAALDHLDRRAQEHAQARGSASTPAPGPTAAASEAAGRTDSF